MRSRSLKARPGITYRVGLSARGDSNPQGRLRHASTAVRASRTGRNVLALCGTSIRPSGDWVNKVVRNERFTGAHPRDCRGCVAAIDEAND